MRSGGSDMIGGAEATRLGECGWRWGGDASSSESVVWCTSVDRYVYYSHIKHTLNLHLAYC